jgi:hypothetical protein
VVTGDQVVIGAEIVPEGTDFGSFHPLLDSAREALDAAGVDDPIRAAVADAGYSTKGNRDRQRPVGNDPIQLVDVPPLGGRRSIKPSAASPADADWVDPRFKKDPTLHRMVRRLANPAGSRLYARRKTMVEPVFGQLKTLNGTRVQHRGREAVSTEWKMMATAHNLLKYWRRTTVLAVG